jgi:hypothetical protein
MHERLDYEAEQRTIAFLQDLYLDVPCRFLEKLE